MCDELLNLLSLPVSSLCFVCRLCACVIDASSAVNIFCTESDLVEKINRYLPIAVDEADPFPKTVCHLCSEQVNKFHDLVQKSILFEEHLRRTLDSCTLAEIDVEAFGQDDELDIYQSTESDKPLQDPFPPEVSSNPPNSQQEENNYIGVPCQVCNDTLANFEQCLSHQRMHVNISICVVCSYKGDSMVDLNVHLAKHFCETLPPLAKAKTKENNAGSKVNHCVKCGMMLENVQTAVEHCTYHRPTDISSYSCVVCSGSISMDNMQEHMTEHFQIDSYPLVCEACCIEYPNEKALKYHRCISLRKYKCSQCKLAFQSEDRLKFHENFHVTKKTFCDICKKDFKFESRMFIHVTGAHEGKKDNQFCCDTCGRTFRWMTALSAHQQTHTNDRPLVCDQCKSRFFNKAALNAHMLSHETTRRFHCLRCDYSSHRKLNLLNHASRYHKEIQNSQTVFQCVVCQEVFPNYADMQLEGHGHDNVKSEYDTSENRVVTKLYRCERCDCCYSCVNSLAIHRVVHDGADEPPYRCRLCGVGFNKHDLLVRHRKIHGNITSRYTGSLSVLIVLICNRCGVECLDYSQLLDHKERSNCFQGKSTGMVRPKTKLTASRLRPLKSHELNINADGLYECPQCRRTYKNRRRYRLHLATHNL